MERVKGWNLKLEGVREWGFGFGRREESGAMVAAATAVVVVMLPIFCVPSGVPSGDGILISVSSSDFSYLFLFLFVSLKE